MYLHIGQDRLLKKDDIVGIFDLDTASVSRVTRDYLKKAQDAGEVRECLGELPVSFIVARGGVYLSPVAARTLGNRF